MFKLKQFLDKLVKKRLNQLLWLIRLIELSLNLNMMVKLCIRTSYVLLIWSMLLSPLIRARTWVTFWLNQNKVQLLSDQEKNVGLSP